MFEEETEISTKEEPSMREEDAEVISEEEPKMLEEEAELNATGGHCAKAWCESRRLTDACFFQPGTWSYRPSASLVSDKNI